MLRALLDAGHLHGDALTIDGSTLEKALADAAPPDGAVVHGAADPFRANAGLVVLTGNDGDIIRIDATTGTLELMVNDAELGRRRAGWRPRHRDLAGVAEKYARLVGPAHLGAVTHRGNVSWPLEPPAGESSTSQAIGDPL